MSVMGVPVTRTEDTPRIDHLYDHGQNTGHITSGLLTMTTIQASEFKAKCLALMDDVARTGESIVITKNGKPVAELRPYHPPRIASPIGLHKGRSAILGDVIEPLGAGAWKALT